MSAHPCRCALWCAGLLAASGCGFHLQGHKALPEVLRVTYVQAKDRQSDFVQDLRKELLTSGARLTTTNNDATAVVHVVNDDFARRVLSVSASDQPAEYELTYTVRFSVSAANKEILAVQEVSGVRDYTFDETILLAKENEEAILREALAHDLADVVMRRLANL
ncbi:MAG TPA: LPS assembly lipoprotein LptE [Steroidobacteraceae bacterium]